MQEEDDFFLLMGEGGDGGAGGENIVFHGGVGGGEGAGAGMVGGMDLVAGGLEEAADLGEDGWSFPKAGDDEDCGFGSHCVLNWGRLEADC